MYSIVGDGSLKIVYYGQITGWVGVEDSVDAPQYASVEKTVRVLDYSDWSIEKVSINSLMAAILDKRLSLSDFLNLKMVNESIYKVGYPRLLTKDRNVFSAKGITMQLVHGVLLVELTGDRWFSIGVADNSFKIQYKALFPNCFPNKLKTRTLNYAKDLLPFKDIGYVFGFFDTPIKIFMLDNRFVVGRSFRKGTKFSYMSKSELARACLLQV